MSRLPTQDACLHAQGEMTSAAFEQELIRHGTFHQKSAAYQQWQNGVSESAVRLLSTQARTLLADSGMGPCHWEYAVEHSAFLLNTAHPFREDSNITQWEAFYGAPPSNGVLCPIGCYAVCHKGKERVVDWKWSYSGTPGVNVGFGFTDGYKTYKILDPTTGTTTFSPSAVTTFDISYFPFRRNQPPRWPMLDLSGEEEPLDVDTSSPPEELQPVQLEPYVLRTVSTTSLVPQSPRLPALSDPPSRTPSVGLTATPPPPQSLIHSCETQNLEAHTRCSRAT
eukprot:891109-Rhodomonas_salina.1